MAKTEAQVITLTRAVADGLDNTITFLDETFEADADAISTAIAAADDQPEDDVLAGALAALRAAGTAFLAAYRTLASRLDVVYGRLGGAPDLSDSGRNLEALRSFLIAEEHEVESAGHTLPTAWDLGGSNYGNGKFLLFTDDATGNPADVLHGQTITLECVADGVGSPAGTVAGAESFQIRGESAARYLWEDGGTAGQRDYARDHGKGVHDWPVNARVIRDGGTLNSVDAATAGIVTNGGFEGDEGEGADKVPEWTIASGADDVSLVTSGPFKSLQSLNAVGNFVMSQSLVNKIKLGVPHAICVAVRFDAGVTDGIVTVKIKDDSTTHVTLTVNEDNVANDTWVHAAPVYVVLPKAIGENLRIEIALASHAGSGNVKIDECVVAELVLFDQHLWTGVIGGALDWRIGDSASEATAVGAGGKIQRRIFNQVFGVHMPHGAGDTWTDAAA